MEQAQNKTLKRWEDLDITDDFIFTRVMRNKKLCPNIILMAASQLPPPTGGLGGGKPPSGAGGSRSKHAVHSFQRRGGFRRGKTPLPSRGVVPS